MHPLLSSWCRPGCRGRCVLKWMCPGRPFYPRTLWRVGETAKHLSLTAQLRRHFRHLKKNKHRSANKSSGRGDTHLRAAFPALPVAWQLDVEDQLRSCCLFANIWLNITGHIVKAVQSLLKYILGFMCKSVQISGWAHAVSGTITGVQVCLQWDAACWRFYICVLY